MTRIYSIIFKAITLLLVFFIFSVMLLIFFLINGIKLNNLSFGGIDISELYLKYDKKLFLQISNLGYQGKKLDCNISIGSDHQKFIVEIENFYYQNLKMNFSGKLLLDIEEIEALKDGTKKELTFDAVSIIFDQNLSPILAEKFFVHFQDDINFRFLHPTLDGVKLDNSTIDIVDLAHDGILKVYLDIYNMLDLRILKILGNYEVELPFKQIRGATHTLVHIDIPFSDDLGTVISAVAKVQNGVVSVGDNHLNVKHTPPDPNSKTKVSVRVELANNKVLFEDYAFHSDLLHIEYEKDVIKIASKQNDIHKATTMVANIENLNAMLKEKKLFYAVDIKDPKANFITVVGDTNLKEQITTGDFFVRHFNYDNKAIINSEQFTFKVQHKPLNVQCNGDFGVDMQVENNLTQKVLFENFELNYKNNTVKLYANILEENNTATLQHTTDLDKNSSNGTVFISNFEYKDEAKIQNQSVYYKVEHEPLIANITGDIEILLTNNGKNESNKIRFEKLVARYENNQATIDTNIRENQNLATLHNTSYFDKNVSNGALAIENYEYEDKAKMQNQTLLYTVNHQPFTAKVSGNIEILLKDTGSKEDKKISFENFLAQYQDEKVTVHSDIIENNNTAKISNVTYLDKDKSNGSLFINNFQYDDVAKLQNQTINYEVKHKPFQAHITSDLTATLQNKETILNGLDVVYGKNSINLKTNYLEGNASAYLTNTTNLDTNTSKGNLELKTFTFKQYLDLKNEFLQYSVDFKNGIKASIPKYLLTYTKDANNTQNLFVGKLNNLLGKVNLVSNKSLNNGTLHISSNKEFQNTNIIINDLGVDINSTLFKSDQADKTNETVVQAEQNNSDLPKISLKMFNSKVSIDGMDLNSSSILGEFYKQDMDIKYLPQDENSTIKLYKSGDSLSIKATGLSDNFINSLAKKDIFDDGLFSLDIDGNKTNMYGGMYVRDTTVKNVRILNNLISFVNTTPAIINPLLALPTLFRMSETNFDMNGYLIKDGYVKFDYDYENKFLNLPSFYTRSKMMDFKGKGKVDIANKKLEAGIDVIFLKDYSKFVNHIPLIGYILTGDDGNFVTNVDINGTFETQEFTTHAISNTAEGVVNMIKRTISVPFIPFMDNGKKEDGNSTKQNTTNTTNEGN